MKLTIDNISKKIALKLNVDIKVIEEVNRSQWHMLKDIMQGRTYAGVKIIYIGKFHKKGIKSEGQINFLKMKKLEKEKNESSTGNI